MSGNDAWVADVTSARLRVIFRPVLMTNRRFVADPLGIGEKIPA
jgi:hypothetical protein